MTIKERQTFAKQSIEWTGDLSDNCTAIWAGLMLRAEWMDEDYWCWAVYDIQKAGATIDNSNNYSAIFIGGEVARQKAGSVAQQYIAGLAGLQQTAKYLIADSFKITGRGLVLAGYIKEGLVSKGDTIEFIAFSTLFQRKINAIEGITKSQPDKVNTGLVIECLNDAEIDELKDWRPDNFVATIYKAKDT